MNCWEILGIEPGSDQKIIKAAYSKLLKTTRPDQDPEGFKRLHAAYKAALDTVKSSHRPTPQARDSADLDSTPIAADNISDNISTATPSGAEHLTSAIDQAELNDEYEEHWHRFTSLVNKTILDQHLANQLSAWKDALKSPLLTDLQQKQRASDYVFDAISEKNVLLLDDDTLFVDAVTLNYLNTYFSWNVNWKRLNGKFSQERLDAVLPFLDEEEKHAPPKEERPHIFSRLVSYLTTLLAIVAGYLHLNMFIVVTVIAVPVTINRIYTRKWQTKHYGRVMGAEDESIEKSKFLMYPILFIAMWVFLLCTYGIGRVIGYFFR